MASYRRLPSGRIQATIRTPSGRRTRSDPLKSVVKAWAEEAEAKIRRGEWTDPHDGRVTVGSWWEQWSGKRDVELATERREESNYRVHIKPRWGHVQLSKVTTWDVESWVVQMKRAGVGETTRGQVVRLFRAILADAARHRLIPVDPTAGVKVPAPPKHVDRILTRAEWEALDAAAGRDAMIACLCLAGLRWAEAAGLHAHRVWILPDSPDGSNPSRARVREVIRRDRSVKGKPKSRAGERDVPLVATLRERLAPLVEDGGLLFRGPDGGPLDYSNWRRDVWLPALAAAGLADPQPTPHDLRHTFGTWLAEGGVPAFEIAALMGHATLRATERYLHAGDGRMVRAVAALG